MNNSNDGYIARTPKKCNVRTITRSFRHLISSLRMCNMFIYTGVQNVLPHVNNKCMYIDPMPQTGGKGAECFRRNVGMFYFCYSNIVLTNNHRAILCSNVYKPPSHLRDGGCTCSRRSRRGLVQEDKRMAFVYTHGLFIT